MIANNVHKNPREQDERCVWNHWGPKLGKMGLVTLPMRCHKINVSVGPLRSKTKEDNIIDGRLQKMTIVVAHDQIFLVLLVTMHL